LREFWESSPKYADSQASLEAWYFEVLKASWFTPQDIKVQYHSASTPTICIDGYSESESG